MRRLLCGGGGCSQAGGGQLYSDLELHGAPRSILTCAGADSTSHSVTDLSQCGSVKNAATNKWFLSIFDLKSAQDNVFSIDMLKKYIVLE